MELELGFGKKTVTVELPDKNVLGILQPTLPPQEESPEAMLQDALHNPIGTRRLSNIVQPGETVAIVTSDITRPMPSAIVLPALLQELELGGIKKADIVIVFALGSHRKHTEEEQRYLVGDEVYESVRCIDSNQEDCVEVGETPTNHTPLKVFRPVAEADRIICMGNIEYHYFAGYSGGGKALMPGVCTREAIQANHSLMVLDAAKAGDMDSNPVRIDIEEATEIIGCDFILNVVLDEHKKIRKIVCGHAVQAHRAGAAYLDTIYQIPISARGDIVLVSPGGYPKDINLYQAQKALDNAKHAVRKGGIIVWVASCKEGYGEHVFERWIEEADESGDLIKRVNQHFELGGHKAAAISMVLQNARVFLVSEMEESMVCKAFLEPFVTVEEALRQAFLALGDDATIWVMPYGGSTLPLPPKN